MINYLNKIIFNLVFILLFTYAYVVFSGRGAFGTYNLYGFGRILLLTNSIITIYLFFIFFKIKRINSLIVVIILWIFWLIITCFISFEFGSNQFIFAVLEVSYAPLIFLFFYYFGKINPNLLRASYYYFLLLMTFNLILFYFIFINYNSDFSNPLTQLNDVYYLLLLLPWVLILPNNKLKLLFLLILTFVIFISLKRAAIISYICSVITYYIFENYRLTKFSIKNLTKKICTVSLILFLIFLFVNSHVENQLTERLKDVTSDGGSGRINIYKKVIDYQVKSPFYFWITGHGHNSVRKYLAPGSNKYISAHNDWLEVLFDYGLPGLIIYLYINIYLGKILYNLIKCKSKFGPPMAASYVIFITVSLVSHLVLYASYFSYIMAFWGTIFAFANHEKKTTMIKNFG
jgi:O-antigen ligase